MRLILTGCEHSGTTTLAVAIRTWAQETLGLALPIHDHWKLPHASGHPPYETITNLTDDEKRQLLELTPKLKEVFTRYTTYYHTPSSRQDAGSILVGHYIEDLVYGEMRFSYGGDGEPGDRRAVAHDIERRLLEYAPETVLVLVKASPGVIAARMKAHPHDHGLLREADIEPVLQRFEDEHRGSRVRHKLVLDTSTATPDETLAEFAQQIDPHLTDSDRLRSRTRYL